MVQDPRDAVPGADIAYDGSRPTRYPHRAIDDTQYVPEDRPDLRTPALIGEFLSNVDRAINVVGNGAPGSHAANPIAYARWLRDIGSALGNTGIALFIAKQAGLHAMNAENAKVFNPAYFALRAPFLNSVAPVAIGPTHEEVALARELAAGGIAEVPLASTKNAFGPDHGVYSAGEPGDFEISGLVDAALGESNSDLLELQFVPGAPGVMRQNVTRESLSALFNRSRTTLTYTDPHPRVLDKGGPAIAGGQLAASAFVDGRIPSSFPREDDTSATMTPIGANPSDPAVGGVDDDEAYVPLSFTDLRPVGNRFRTVFFRPFDVNVSEDFAPEWNDARYFGRVDPVMCYGGTTRTISLSFTQVAFGPEDLRVIYQKINWLVSMVYPEYDRDLLMKAGPVCRLRVGDVIRGSSGMGLPGVITQLGYDYGDALWELKKGSKVPRNVSISLGFTVLHDAIVGRGDAGSFGGIDPSRFDVIADSRGRAVARDRQDSSVVTAPNFVNSPESFRGFGSTLRDPEDDS